uniref:Ankyrin repeat, SAM and basic leucine zipper domain-containing protein 1-like n=1 Tax=Crassostrea virginica TaxID=6565 RepID=A0A8B8B314_CRAVI|nr:ankyrin repeat, SAM and basic leucine zipper domain-containing protein 1-like [Crassostrea virginica]
MSSAPKRKMATSMDFCPGGAEFDEDDDFDEGFLFDQNDIKDHDGRDSHETLNGNANSYENRGGFGTPSSPSKSIKTRQPAMTERRAREISTVGADDFRMAVLRGSLDAVKDFINKGFNVNTVLKCGWTPLMYAVSSAFPQITKFLLDNGADPHGHKDMYTVLMAACGSAANQEENILQCVSYLLERGVNVNTHDRYHMSPLMYACREGRVKVVSKLLDNNANINKQDSRGWTPLSWAVSKNHQGVVKLLVERGADTQKLHCDGQTALDIAIAMDLQPIMTLLGGNPDPSVSTGCNNSALPTTNGWTKPPNSTVPETSMSSKKAIIYGELEMFLTGLGLNHLVQVFQQQQVDFDMFLQLTDEDLIKMGIDQIGVHKKILDGIHTVHKRDWEKGSLSSVKYNKKMSCVEAVAMTANISKHTKYLTSTIHYIADQVTLNSPLLDIQDGATPKQLEKHCKETLVNVRLLEEELKRLSSRLQKVFGKRNVDPPDLVTSPVHRKSRVNYKRVLLASSVCIPVGIVLYYRKDLAVHYINRMLSIRLF